MISGASFIIQHFVVNAVSSAHPITSLCPGKTHRFTLVVELLHSAFYFSFYANIPHSPADQGILFYLN